MSAKLSAIRICQSLPNVLHDFRHVPAIYWVHMKGQFKFIQSQKRGGLVVDGSAQLSSVREIVLQPNKLKNRCLSQHHYSDSYMYEFNEGAMGNCTVPWTMNNSIICMNEKEAKNADRIDRMNTVSLSPKMT